MQTQTENYTVYTYADEGVSVVDNEQYTTDIHITSRAISALWHDVKKVVALKHIHTHLPIEPKLLDGLFDALNINYTGTKEHRLFVDSPYFTLVPEALFDSSSASTYLDLLYILPPQVSIHFNRIASHAMVLVYAFEQQTIDKLKQFFPGAPVKHYTEIMLKHGLLHHTENDMGIYGVVENGFLTLIGFSQKSIAFFNRFKTEADTDVVYYLLSAAEDLGLNTAKPAIVIAGDINSNGSLFTLMKKYIPGIRLMLRYDQVSFPAAFNQFSEPLYHLPIHSLLCE